MSFHGAFWAAQHSLELSGDVHPYAIHLVDVLNKTIEVLPKQFVAKAAGVFYGDETTPLFAISNGRLSLRYDPQYPTDSSQSMTLTFDNYSNDCDLMELIKDSKSMGNFYTLNRVKK